MINTTIPYEWVKDKVIKLIIKIGEKRFDYEYNKHDFLYLKEKTDDRFSEMNIHFKECGTCRLDFYFENGNCVDICSKGHYLDGGSCLPCQEGCVECWESNECVECDDSFFLEETTCKTSCSAGFSPVAGNQCLPCRTGCDTCSGPTQQELFQTNLIRPQFY